MAQTVLLYPFRVWTFQITRVCSRMVTWIQTAGSLLWWKRHAPNWSFPTSPILSCVPMCHSKRMFVSKKGFFPCCPNSFIHDKIWCRMKTWKSENGFRSIYCYLRAAKTNCYLKWQPVFIVDLVDRFLAGFKIISMYIRHDDRARIRQLGIWLSCLARGFHKSTFNCPVVE